MAGGGELTAPVTRAARGCVRARGAGEKKVEVTAESETVSASSGRRRRRQIDGGDPRWPRRGTAELAASRASGAFLIGEEEEGARRGFLARRRGEGSTVAVANGVRDDELRSGREGERAEEGEEVGRE